MSKSNCLSLATAIFFAVLYSPFTGCKRASLPSEDVASTSEPSADAPIRHIVSVPRSIQVEGYSSTLEQSPPPDADSILIGIDADFSHNSAAGGIAILRGVQLAIEQINSSGGLLGRKLQIVRKDHHGNPRRGIDNLVELSRLPNLVAVVGGVHTPVAIEELPTIHDREIIYLGPWAAGTQVVSNGYDPNFVFRVSVRDEYAGEFLVRSATERGYRRIGLVLEQTGWGKSNEQAITAALLQRGLAPSCVTWFDWNERSLSEQINQAQESATEAIILVANAPEGATFVNEVAARPVESRMPIFSHWGIQGGEFREFTAGSLAKVDIKVLQTFSFATNNNANAQWLEGKYRSRFKLAPDSEIRAPFATAHAYDLIQLLARAINDCQSTQRSQIRSALEKIDRHEGVVKVYEPPFTRIDHDALDLEDFQLMQFTLDGPNTPAKWEQPPETTRE